MKIALSLLAAFLLAPEAALYLASNRAFVPAAADHCAVIVLGSPGRADGTPSEIQLFRMEVGLETLKKYRCSSMILTGGNPHSALAEADVMAQVALRRGVPRDKLILEEKAANTWQNIRYSLPSVKDDEQIFIASDALHARRALYDLCLQSPGACPRAHVAATFRPFDHFAYQWAGAYWTLKSVLMDCAYRWRH